MTTLNYGGFWLLFSTAALAFFANIFKAGSFSKMRYILILNINYRRGDNYRYTPPRENGLFFLIFENIAILSKLNALFLN